MHATPPAGSLDASVFSPQCTQGSESAAPSDGAEGAAGCPRPSRSRNQQEDHSVELDCSPGSDLGPLQKHACDKRRVSRNREAVGRLRVRCVGASQLPTAAADVHLLRLPWSNPNPYMLVYLRDRHNQLCSPQRRTRVIPKTPNPQWREEFWFAIRKTPENLVLHVNVFDQDEAKGDHFLGRAVLPLDYRFLREATRKRQIYDLDLLPDPNRNLNIAPGVAKIEVGWEPSLVLNSAASARAIAWVLLRSPHVLRVLSVVLLGLSCCFLLVAHSSRWLCSGPSLPRCRVVEVSGAGTCALLSAVGACMACGIHFLASAGLFGSGWEDRPPTLVELAEADIGDDDATVCEEPRSNIQMQVQSGGAAFPAMLRWDISVSTRFLPKISCIAVRLFAWLAHLAALVLAGLALLLTWANTSSSTFLAEAAYIDAVAFLFLISGGVAVWREGNLLRDQADKWQVPSEGMSKFGIQEHGAINDNAGGSVQVVNPATPLGFEELAQRAQQQIQTAQQQIQSQMQTVAQPLVEARQRISEHFGDLRSRGLQVHLDELNLAQPLIEARQRFQEHLDTLNPEGAVPPAESDAESDPFPPRWSKRWMQPLLDGVAQHGNPDCMSMDRRRSGSYGELVPLPPEETQHASEVEPRRAEGEQAHEERQRSHGSAPDPRQTRPGLRWPQASWWKGK